MPDRRAANSTAGAIPCSVVPDPAVVLVILLAADAADPSTQAVLPAARRPLGDDTVVLVQQATSTPSDEDAVALARQVHATSAVSLDWEDPAHSRVRVRVFLVNEGGRYEYELVFRPHDDPSERGRAIGLAMTPVLTRAIASARRQLNAEPSAAPPSSAPLAVTPAPQPPPAAAPLGVPDPAGGEGKAAVPTARPHPARVALDVSGVASVGLGGNALGAGPSVGVRAYLLGPVGVHAIAWARFGAVDAASASSSTLAAGGGLVWRIARFGGHSRPLEVGVRADALAMEVALTQGTAGMAVRRARWLTAFDAVLEGACSIASHFDVTAGVGAELVAGPTSVRVGRTTVDDIPLGRMVADLGVRLQF
jgi:hypothetical protein